MRPEPDVYSIETDDSPDIYSLDRDDGSSRPLSTDYDLPREPFAPLKKSWSPSRNNRKSCRIAVPDARQSCELKVGAHLLSALLVDESKGGFSIMVDCLEGIKSGKRANLHTDMGWFKVRIVYIKKVARPAHADPKCDCWFRLGLRKARSFLLF